MIVHARPGQIKLFCQEVFACISTLPGYWAAGFACGAIGRVSGFDTVEIALLSIFLYAGSAHFLFYSLTAAGTGIGQIAIAFINIRLSSDRHLHGAIFHPVFIDREVDQRSADY